MTDCVACAGTPFTIVSPARPFFVCCLAREPAAKLRPVARFAHTFLAYTSCSTRSIENVVVPPPVNSHGSRQ